MKVSIYLNNGVSERRSGEHDTAYDAEDGHAGSIVNTGHRQHEGWYSLSHSVSFTSQPEEARHHYGRGYSCNDGPQ